MKIISARLGEIEVSAGDVITFPDGIIGFPDIKGYVELEFLEGSPLKLLQAVTAPKLAFFIIDPALFNREYKVDSITENLGRLDSKTAEEIQVRAIVTIPDDPYQMTANLQGPLLINRQAGLAMQIVNRDQRYTTKHKILVNPETSSVAR